jgi:hypothetical protein
MNSFRRTILLLLLIVMLSVTSQTASQGLDRSYYLPIISREYDPNWHWNTLETVELNLSSFSDPFLLIDQAGRVHIFWDTYSSPGPAFIYHTYKTETGWSPPQAIAETLGSSQLLLQPLQSPDGKIHLVWYNRLTAGNYRLMYAYFLNNTWSLEEEVTTFTQPFPEARMNFDALGDLHVTYHIPGIISEEIFHRERTSSGWLSP